MVGVDSFSGKTFLDIGSGSGLSSLAAKRSGAKVYSFDYDPYSVGCTKELNVVDPSDWTRFLAGDRVRGGGCDE